MPTNFLTNKADVKAWLDKYKIKNYRILKDLSVEVNDDVKLMALKLKEIPVKFNNILGSFYCNANSLTSLDFSPTRVGGSFVCNNNHLTSLIGGPEEVGASYRCENNKLTTLQGAPKKIGGHFDCSNNKLNSLQYCPKLGVNGFVCDKNKLTSLKYAPLKVRTVFSCEHNQLTSLEFVPKHIGDSLYAGFNNILTLEFFPQKVSSGEVYLFDNPGLGRIQKMWNFKELLPLHEETVKIKNEQKSLDNSLNKNASFQNKTTSKFKI